MARSSVPKFGNWENEDNVPYTVYFDKARENRGGGKVINPNNPEENPDTFPNYDPAPAVPAPSNPPPTESRTKPDDPNWAGPRTQTNMWGGVDSDFRRFTNSPAWVENLGQRSANESSYGGRAKRPARPTRRSEGSEQSPNYQAKVIGRGIGSPVWEGKNHDSSHGTPGRSRLKPTTWGAESPEKGAAVPRFGEWDESDPQAAENFTQRFNKVREERNAGPNNASGTPEHPSYGARPQQAKEAKKRYCFCW